MQYVHSLQKKYSLGSFDLLAHTAPVQATSLLLAGPIVDFWLTEKKVTQYEFSTSSVVRKHFFYAKYECEKVDFKLKITDGKCFGGFVFFQFFIILSCIIAVGTNLSQFICIGRFTAVTFQVLGHMKTVLVLILGFFLFGREGMNLQVVLGMMLAILGMIWYGNASSKPGGKERRHYSVVNDKGQRGQNISLEDLDADEKV